MTQDLAVSITVGAALAASFGNVLDRSKRQVVSLGKSIARSEKTAADVRGYRELERSVERTGAAHRRARAEANRLARTLAAAERPTDALRAATALAVREADRLGRALDRGNRDLRERRGALQAAGIAVGGLDRREAELGRTLRRQKAALAETNRLLERRGAIVGRRQELRGGLVGAAAAGYGLARAMKSTIGAAVDFESRMADVAKVVDFDSPEGIRDMGRSIQELSTRIPVTASGLADIVAAAGQAGIARAELTRFAEDAAKIAVAFDVSGREAGGAMTGLRTIFKLNQDQAVDLAGAYNHLSNNMDATASGLLNIANRAGSTAAMFGLNGKQLGALGATFLALKTPPEVAATGINAMLMRLQTADKQSEKFQRALNAIGLSADELKDRIAEDAQGALIEFLAAVKGADDVGGALFDLFGQEYADDITKVVDNLDEYKKAVATAASAEANAASIEAEYRARAATTENSLRLLANRWNRLGVNVGAVFLPAVVGATRAIGSVVDKVTMLAERYPQATKVVVGLAFGLIGLKIASVGARWALTYLAEATVMARLRFAALRQASFALGEAFRRGRARAMAYGAALQAMPGRIRALGAVGAARAGLGTIAGGFVVAAKSVGAFTLALLTNPVGWIVAGIAAGALLIVKFWRPIKAFFVGLWEGVKEGFGPLGETIGDLGGMIAGLFAPIQFADEALAGFAETGKLVGKVVGGALRVVFGAVVGTVRAMMNLGRVMGNLLTLDFKGAWAAGKDLIGGVAADAKGVGAVFNPEEKTERPAGSTERGGRRRGPRARSVVAGAALATAAATPALAVTESAPGAVFAAATGNPAEVSDPYGGPAEPTSGGLTIPAPTPALGSNVTINGPVVGAIEIHSETGDPDELVAVVERRIVPLLEARIGEIVARALEDDGAAEDDG